MSKRFGKNVLAKNQYESIDDSPKPSSRRNKRDKVKRKKRNVNKHYKRSRDRSPSSDASVSDDYDALFTMESSSSEVERCYSIDVMFDEPKYVEEGRLIGYHIYRDGKTTYPIFKPTPLYSSSFLSDDEKIRSSSLEIVIPDKTFSIDDSLDDECDNESNITVNVEFNLNAEPFIPMKKRYKLDSEPFYPRGTRFIDGVAYTSLRIYEDDEMNNKWVQYPNRI